jgi:hypothetical protein
MSALQKLMQARIKLQSTALKKSGMNKFAGYQYFELSDFLPQIQQIFFDLKLAGVVSFASDQAKLVITDTEDSTSVEIFTPMATAQLKGCHDIQNLGAVQTYIRRYLWVTALEIVEHDVIDGGNMGEPEKPKLTPNNGKAWGRAINVYLSEGNLDSVKKHMSLTEDNETKLINDAEALKASIESENAVA